ncbi:methyl-accepting chemotaxis protein [Sessilibacter corallicola]|uniref:Methyl-accepting chemotaxis protein n=1 Tax=Sessilibacter corallicola TaxID=2904075 RepID=A0ABQ0A4T4_9GAMM|nr:methyl-accepting chemotaxis protein [Sessilibacter corallicola]MCE2026726.1 methyl-accepting chemotaxis protein [Sessilibacter corallicola]
MFQKLKLTAQISVGFASIIVLLIVISTSSWFGVNNVYNGLVEYRELARDTNLTGRLQANMLMVRLGVLKFLNERSEESITQYEERLAKVETFMDEAKVEIQKPERAQLIQKSAQNLGVYKEGFTQVVDLFRARNELVQNQLDPSGLAMRERMTSIITSAYADDDASAAFYAAQVQEHLLLGRLYVSKYLITNAAADRERANQELNAEIAPFVEELDVNLQNPLRRESLRVFKEQHQQYITAFDNVAEIIEERNALINGTLNRVGPIIAADLENVKLSVKKDQDALGPEIQALAENTVSMIVILSVVSVIVAVILSWITAKSIRKPIGGEPAEIAAITRNISKGDLSQDLNASSRATGIYRSVSEMSKMLKSLIGDIVKTSKDLSENATSASQISEQTAKIIDQQRSKTSTVAAAVSEMAMSIQDVVRHATDSATQSNEGLSEVERGKETTSKTLAEIGGLATNLETTVEFIKTLEQSSSDIEVVIGVIQNISEQTNLLALNAAIEAARAGEQGRGFAVVADEVRTLAQRTQSSTTEIQEIIQRLQSGTADTVKAIGECHSKSQKTVAQSQETAQALELIHNAINMISKMNIQVASAVEQQSTVADEIAKDLESISSGFEETSEGAKQSASANDHVSNISRQLQGMVSKFRV